MHDKLYISADALLAEGNVEEASARLRDAEARVTTQRENRSPAGAFDDTRPWLAERARVSPLRYQLIEKQREEERMKAQGVRFRSVQRSRDRVIFLCLELRHWQMSEEARKRWNTS